jgi:threonine dehydrogenase-like Zn-dependent dehydrogenase
MALLWSHREKGVLYQVRAAGSSRRLYTDGVLHSQFNPRRIVTGSVWDLLWLPVFFLAAPRIERVLLLGAGAGAVIRQLDVLFQPKEIVAVENNPVHVRIAREFFGVTRQMTALHQVDAAEFIRRYRGKRFDLIIDDLFIAHGSVAQRALSCDSRWVKQLVRHLRTNGVLCVNFADRREYLAAPFFSWFGRGRRFGSAFELRSPSTENVIAAMLPGRADASSLRAHLQATPALASLLKAGHLRYQVRSMALRQ